MSPSTPSPATTTGSIAALLKAELIGPADIAIGELNSLDGAGPASLAFIRSAAYAAQWSTSKAGAALVSRGVDVPGHDSQRRALLIVPDADLALIPLLEMFAPKSEAAAAGVHPSAIVHPTARVEPGACIGPLCQVGDGASIGSGATLIASVTVGRGASIGRDTVLHPHVVVGDRCVVGQGCILHPGVVLGADGFGFQPSPDGRGVIKIPHIGDVRIGDRVEIGANSCVDRAKFGSTTIGSGTKIDNLVQIGHNCRIGRACLICGQCGLSGSVTLGDGVILAGQVGIADNLTIGARARVGARSGVGEDIPPGETWLGTPAMPARDMAKNYAVLRDIATHVRELRRQQRLDAPQA